MNVWKLTILYFFIIQGGLLASECVKVMHAKELGMSHQYFRGAGRVIFSNISMQNEFEHVAEDKIEFKFSKRLQRLERKDENMHASVVRVGILFCLIVSFTALLIYFIRRIKCSLFITLDYILLGLSLFFMKPTLLFLSGVVLGGIPCNEAKFFRSLNLCVFDTMYLFASIGSAMFLLFLVGVLSKDKRKEILIALAICTPVSIVLWVFGTGYLLNLT